MAKITIGFEVPRKDGYRKVVLNLSHRGGRKRIPVDIELSPKDVAKDRNGNIKVKSDTKRFEIDQVLHTYNERLHEIHKEFVGVELTVDDIYNHIIKEKKTGCIDFFEFAEQWLADEDIKGKKNYRTMLNSLEAFHGSRHLPFSEIDGKLLTEYSKFLKDRPRAQSMYLGAIRHIHNKARLFYNTDDRIVIPTMVFERFKVPKQQMKGGRAISVEHIRRIIGFEGTGRAGLARDCFVLSFLIMGMNSADMYDKDAILKGDMVCYHRKKTRDRRADDAYIEVDVLPLTENLIKKYKGRTRLFDFYERYANEASFNRAINIGLNAVEKAINEQIEKENQRTKNKDEKLPLIENLQFYQARHTWASIARNELGIDAYTVDKALNHLNRDLRLLDVYVKRDFTLINEANKKVIDFVLGNEKGGAE